MADVLGAGQLQLLIDTLQKGNVALGNIAFAITNNPHAPITSPVFKGDPQAPTPPSGDADTSIATTAFVAQAISGISGGGIPDAPNDGTLYARKSLGWWHITHSDITDWTAFVPNPSTLTPSMDGTATPGTTTPYSRGDHVHPTDTSRYAASNPSGYVNAAGAAAAAPVQSVAGRTGTVTLTHADITDWATQLAPYALLASPTFTGTPSLPTGTIGVTQTAGTNNTSLATTAFVTANFAPVTGGSYVAKAGDTMSGALTIALPSTSGASSLVVAPVAGPGGAGITLNHPTGAYASFLLGQVGGKNRWFIDFPNNTAESTGNAGSDFDIKSVADDGATAIGTPLTIERKTGYANFNANGATAVAAAGAAPGHAAIRLNKNGSGNGNYIQGLNNASTRWVMLLGNGTAEGSGNTGGDLEIDNYDNTGAQIGTPLQIIRSSGVVMLRSLTGTYQQLIVTKPASGSQAGIAGYTAGNARWNLVVAGDITAEANVSDGSNFMLQRYNNSGGFIDNPIVCNRTSGQCTFSVTIVNGPSDRRLKENIAPLEGSLDKVKALQGVSFNMIDSPDKPEIGLIAQDVQPIIPEVIQRFHQSPVEGEPQDKAAIELLAIDYPKLVAHLIESIKTLSARVEALEAR